MNRKPAKSVQDRTVTVLLWLTISVVSVAFVVTAAKFLGA